MTKIDTDAISNDEFSYVTVIYLVIGFIIIYLAWISTHVRHEIRDIPYRQRTVFTFNPQTGDFQQHSLGILLNNLSNNLAQATPTFESILDEMNGISYQSPQQQDDMIDDDFIIEEETQEIIREMDREPHNIVSSTSNRIQNRHTASTSTSTASNTPDSADGIHNSDIALSSLASNSSAENSSNQSNNSTESAAVDTSLNNTEIIIKLKYLNDDMKIVRARPNEPIGDFKKRSFNDEINAQKTVRLVFNGHVLQPDTKTIAACGLFDNCVVHCLIHNPRPAVVPESNQSTNNQIIPNEGPSEQIGTNHTNRNRNTQRLLNFSLFLICVSVIISWFFRIQYFQLFSWYSTVGLVLLTTFFLVIIPLIFLIEREIFRNL